jgi:hypothetical protein
MECKLRLQASNGRKSILFIKLLEVSSNQNEALDKYYYTKTDEFKSEFGDWENNGVDDSKLDINGEPKYESLTEREYLNDVDFAAVELDSASEMYKRILEEMPEILSKIDANIEALSKTKKNTELVNKLKRIKPLLLEGDVATGIPKFVESARNHIKNIRQRAETSTDYVKLKFLNQEAASYSMVTSLLDALNETPKSQDIFEGTIFDQEAAIRTDLAAIDNLYLSSARHHLVTELHERNKSWSKESIRKWLLEAPRDTKGTEYMLEALVDSNDKLLASIANIVTNQGHELRRERIEFDNELSDIVEEVLEEGKSSNSEEIFGDIIYTKSDGTTHVLDINAKSTQGKDKAIDAQVLKVQQIQRTKPKLAKFLVFYTENMIKLNSGIPESASLGTRIPTIYKSTFERLEGKTIKDKGQLMADQIKKSILRSNTDTEYGSIVDGTGSPIKRLPTFYTQKYDSVDYDKAFYDKFKELSESGKDELEAGKEAVEYAEKIASEKTSQILSLDLANSLQAFHAMALNYSKKNEILDLVESAKDIVLSTKRKYLKIDSAGRLVTKVNKYGENVPQKIDGKESRAGKALLTFLDMHMYGQKEKDLGYTDIFGRKIDNNKILRQINKKTSLIQMAFNFLASSANVVVGEYNNILEVVAAEHTSVKSYKKAGKIYREDLKNILSDIGERKNSSFINQLNNHYSILGEYNQANVRVTENSKTSRLFKLDILFFLQGSGEHLVQMRMGISVLDNTKTYDKDGKESGTLLDAHKKGEGKVNINEVFVKDTAGNIVKYDSAEQNRMSNKISAILRKVHGNYNSNTATAAKQDARTALVLKYRDWAYEGLVRRFGKDQEYINLEKNAEGFYRSGTKSMGKLIEGIKTLKMQVIKEKWSELTPGEKANMARMIAELGVIATLIGTGALLSYAGKNMDDFDEDSLKDRLAQGGFNYLVYMNNRLTTEISAFINPVETIRLMQSPTASATILENTVKFLYQLTNPLEIRETGSYKGDYELLLKGSKLVPAYKNLSRLNPEGIKDAGVFYIF